APLREERAPRIRGREREREEREVPGDFADFFTGELARGEDPGRTARTDAGSAQQDGDPGGRGFVAGLAGAAPGERPGRAPRGGAEGHAERRAEDAVVGREGDRRRVRRGEEAPELLVDPFAGGAPDRSRGAGDPAPGAPFDRPSAERRDPVGAQHA